MDGICRPFPWIIPIPGPWPWPQWRLPQPSSPPWWVEPMVWVTSPPADRPWIRNKSRSRRFLQFFGTFSMLQMKLMKLIPKHIETPLVSALSMSLPQVDAFFPQHRNPRDTNFKRGDIFPTLWHQRNKIVLHFHEVSWIQDESLQNLQTSLANQHWLGTDLPISS